VWVGLPIWFVLSEALLLLIVLIPCGFSTLERWQKTTPSLYFLLSMMRVRLGWEESLLSMASLM
jgi:hypothetical protein